MVQKDTWVSNAEDLYAQVASCGSAEPNVPLFVHVEVPTLSIDLGALVRCFRGKALTIVGEPLMVRHDALKEKAASVRRTPPDHPASCTATRMCLRLELAQRQDASVASDVRGTPMPPSEAPCLSIPFHLTFQSLCVDVFWTLWHPALRVVVAGSESSLTFDDCHVCRLPAATLWAKDGAALAFHHGCSVELRRGAALLQSTGATDGRKGEDHDEQLASASPGLITAEGDGTTATFSDVIVTCDAGAMMRSVVAVIAAINGARLTAQNVQVRGTSTACSLAALSSSSVELSDCTLATGWQSAVLVIGSGSQVTASQITVEHCVGRFTERELELQRTAALKELLLPAWYGTEPTPMPPSLTSRRLRSYVPVAPSAVIVEGDHTTRCAVDGLLVAGDEHLIPVIRDHRLRYVGTIPSVLIVSTPCQVSLSFVSARVTYRAVDVSGGARVEVADSRLWAEGGSVETLVCIEGSASCLAMRNTHAHGGTVTTLAVRNGASFTAEACDVSEVSAMGLMIDAAASVALTACGFTAKLREVLPTDPQDAYLVGKLPSTTGVHVVMDGSAMDAKRDATLYSFTRIVATNFHVGFFVECDSSDGEETLRFIECSARALDDRHTTTSAFALCARGRVSGGAPPTASRERNAHPVDAHGVVLMNNCGVSGGADHHVLQWLTVEQFPRPLHVIGAPAVVTTLDCGIHLHGLFAPVVLKDLVIAADRAMVVSQCHLVTVEDVTLLHAATAEGMLENGVAVRHRGGAGMVIDCHGKVTLSRLTARGFEIGVAVQQPWQSGECESEPEGDSVIHFVACNMVDCETGYLIGPRCFVQLDHACAATNCSVPAAAYEDSQVEFAMDAATRSERGDGSDSIDAHQQADATTTATEDGAALVRLTREAFLWL